jgi:hypothetical protein
MALKQMEVLHVLYESMALPLFTRSVWAPSQYARGKHVSPYISLANLSKSPYHWIITLKHWKLGESLYYKRISESFDLAVYLPPLVISS